MATLNSNALTTVADVKETLGIPSSNTSKDNLIIRKINQASSMIENYCQRHFVSATYTEYYDGTHTQELVLRERPISALTSLSARNTVLNDDDFTSIDSSDYFFDANGGIITSISSFWGHYDRWKVVYTAGYTTIPSDLAEAAATLAAHLVSSSVGGGGTSNLASMVATRVKEGQREITYANAGGINVGGYVDGQDTLYSALGILGTLQAYANTVISGGR